MKKKILIADDEDRMRRLIKDFLTRSGYEVIEAADGQEALEKFESSKADLAVLDVMMPVYDGWEVCAEIKEISEIPVIMLTALDGEDDEIFSLKNGADDYMPKPFSPKVLIARIENLLKRNADEEEVVEIEGVKIEVNARRVFLGDEEIPLSPKEFELLIYLYQNCEKALKRDKILNEVWGYDYFGDPRTVDTHIKSIRKKLEPLKDHINTVRGVGYRFDI
ncbi:MAG TPA: response regulator transcription factor [Thermotogota bacterium]|nr:response regulator transcription factor [Thermotogota bacterium]HPJ87795.1 response regulator transcription factor [Thermotogota bacterium]HPR95207.1 response regulator transcription factor [Thermotogota bacterium]